MTNLFLEENGKSSVTELGNIQVYTVSISGSSIPELLNTQAE